MTTATLSAYPRSVEELLPAARDMAAELGGVPSRNQLMRAFKVGAPKAVELRTQLLAELGPDVTDHTPVPAKPTDPAPDTDADAHSDTASEPVAEEVAEPGSDTIPAVVEPVADLPANAEPATPVIDIASLAAPDGHPATPTPVPALSSAPEAASHLDPDPTRVRQARPDRKAHKPSKPRKPLVWPVLLLSLPAFVSIWSGWVELGALAGFGVVHPLPGIADDVTFNTAITLPIGVETYAAYALWVWLSGRAPRKARRFAKWSALGSLVFGAAGQIAYHLLAAAGVTSAPWQITSAVACLPVAVLGMGAALAHLMHADQDDDAQA